MSFDEKPKAKFWLNMSQSLSIRAMSFDERNQAAVKRAESQSLSFRAMSFKHMEKNKMLKLRVSIPFVQGDVFRQRYAGGRNHAAFQTHFPIFLEG